jgi:hypothetical protein
MEKIILTGATFVIIVFLLLLNTNTSNTKPINGVANNNYAMPCEDSITVENKDEINLKFDNTIIHDSILTYISWIESKHTPNIISPNGLWYGQYQLAKVRIKEFNNLYGAKYQLEDALNPQIAKEITKGVLIECAKRYYNKFKRNPSVEEILMMHNKGYDGYKYVNGAEYIERYRKQIVIEKQHIK